MPALHPAAPAGNGASGPVAHAVAMPPAAQAVLPPRPGRAATGQPAGSAWRSWPVVVIVVAMMAIVAAVVLMVWPITRADTGKHTLQPPAPERMDFQTPPITPKIDTRPAPGHAPADPPVAPHASAPSAPAIPDPFGGPHATAPAAPAAPAVPDSPGDPPQADQVASDDDPAADDLFSPRYAAPGSPTPRGRPAVPGHASGLLQITMAARLCRKLARCATTDSTMKDMCEQIASMGVPSDPPAGCPAAERCLRHIDAIGCSSQPDALQIGLMMMQFSDCVAAMRC